VTALAFYVNSAGTLIILAGEGCYLKAFEAVTSKLICQCRIFTDQTVHGIVVQEKRSLDNDLRVVIWGGSSLILLTNSLLEQILTQDVKSIEDFEVRTSDWILDVVLSTAGENSCVLITAHNTLLRARLETNSRKISLNELGSPSRSILYSAHLAWTDTNCVLIAAGTVFGEIVMWEWSEVNSLPICRVVAVFIGHEGSIFGVNISPPISIGPFATTRLLVSCSDDRTIRVWDIYGRTKTPKITDGSEVAAFHESTSGEGAGSNDKEGSSRCIAAVMGHASRIWRVKFRVNAVDNTSSSAVDVISFGEDATAQHWSLRLKGNNDLNLAEQSSCHQHINFGEDRRPVELVHLRTFAFHSGKQIWLAAMHQIIGCSTVLATGGADGKISFYDLPTAVCTKCTDMNTGDLITLDLSKLFPPPQSSIWELEEILAKFPVKLIATNSIEHRDEIIPKLLPIALDDKKPKKKAKAKRVPVDSFNRCSFISSNQLLITTNFGRVFLGHIKSKVIWQELNLPEASRQDLKSYSVVEGGNDVALLAGSNGNILVYRKGIPIQMIAQVSGKIADIFLVDKEQSIFIVTTLGAKIATFLKLQYADVQTQPEKIVLSLPEKFIVTSACVCGVGDKSILIFGSRKGSLAIYDAQSGNSQSDTPILPLKIWESDQPQGDAITSITPLSQVKNNGTRYFLMTGRNSLYSIFGCAVTSHRTSLEGASLYPVHQGTPPLGPNIENAWIDGGDLILSGFRSKSFIVWNETKQYEVANVECGGAHRSYTYSNMERARGCFVYTEASKLFIHTHYRPSHKIIKSGGHGREIKSCAISPDKTLIATGAEDTTIRIWSYMDDLPPSQFDCKAVMQKHSAGIQHLKWHGSRYLFSSGGNEEFFVWAVEDVPGFGIGVLCEATCPEQSDERDLRIMSFDVTETGDNSTTTAPELIISLAYSDSTIRTYLYSKAKGYNLIATGRYTSSCLMQIKHLQINNQKLSILTAATDGSLVLWTTSIPIFSKGISSSSELTKVSSHKIHQSTIKCLDVTTESTQNSVIVVTGGDDNALGITAYSSANLDSKPKSVLLCSAHAAAITGLCILPSSGQNEDDIVKIVSSSNDQKVKEWEFYIERNELRKKGDMFTSVADVGDIAVIRNGDTLGEEMPKVLVVGNGMEVFTVAG